MALFANDIAQGFLVRSDPGVLAVFCVLFGVEDAPAVKSGAAARPPVRIPDLRRLPGAFWGTVVMGIVFTLARFSEAFLILEAHQEGLALTLAPLVLIVMNLIYALGAYPAGVLSDRVPARTLLICGLFCLIDADLALAMLPGVAGAFVGIALWGGHMAFTQGLLAKLVADHAPAELRGSAFGLFNLASGIAMLFASVIAGVVWVRLGPDATFLTGAAFAAVAVALLALGGSTQRQSART